MAQRAFLNGKDVFCLLPTDFNKRLEKKKKITISLLGSEVQLMLPFALIRSLKI